MDTRLWSSGEVADLLATSAPAVRRAAASAGIAASLTPGGHRRFTTGQVSQITSRLGIVPRVDGLSRVEVQVLTAVARHPFGLASIRAVARAAAVSPTAAARAASSLVRHGYVRRDAVTVVDRGAARPGTRWRLVLGEPWFTVAALVSATVLPTSRPGPRPTRVPRRFWHLFWNAEPAALTVDADGGFIATRLILGPDLAARSWALGQLPAAALGRAAGNRAAGPALRAMIRRASGT